MLLLIIILALASRFFSFTGYKGIDDHVYAKMAHRMAQGDFKITESYSHVPIFPFRVGLFAPAALCFKIFGTNSSA